MSKLVIHHLGVSQSERVVWLCEELGIDYELKLYQRAPLFSPPEYCKLHPLCAAPVIHDGELTLGESAACVEYIINTYGQGRLSVKPGEENYADYLYWFHFANGTFQPAIGRNLLLKSAGGDSSSPIVQRYQKKWVEVLSFIDTRLSDVPFLAGQELTAADIMIVFSLTTMRCYFPYDLGDYSNILTYLKRVSSGDAYQRAKQKGDPDLVVEQLIAAGPPPPFKALVAPATQQK